jgi:hypothetical protein
MTGLVLWQFNRQIKNREALGFAGYAVGSAQHVGFPGMPFDGGYCFRGQDRYTGRSTPGSLDLLHGCYHLTVCWRFLIRQWPII